MAGHKPIIAMRLLVLFLGFSCLLSSLAVPSTRSLKSSSEEDDGELSVPNLLAQDEIMGMSGGGEMVFMERRMEMESNDYPGTRAGPAPSGIPPPSRDDPKTPGRA